MLTQLDTEFFEELYQRQQCMTDKVHYRVDIASIPLSIRDITAKTTIIFFPEHRDGWNYHCSVVDFDGTDCFLLSSLSDSPHQPETFIQGSSLLSTPTYVDIIHKVLLEFFLSENDLIWINPGLCLPIYPKTTHQ